MFRAEKWIDGCLWIQTTPYGKWDEATNRELIIALIERMAKLEEMVGRKS